MGIVDVARPVVARAQRGLGTALRGRVAGEDAEEVARGIWGRRGPRWFTPEDPIWRVYADAAMFPGGVAALLLQMLHPGAMAGVAGHSGYRSDPWGRLQRTSTYLSATTFGTVGTAEEAIATVRRIHDRVRGKDAFGRPYRAGDPHLLMWVHVAEIASFLRAYQAYGPQPLPAADADVFVAQTGVAAERLGVVRPPRSVGELEAILKEYRPELVTTDAAREAARFLLAEPPLPAVARPGYWAIAAGGVGLLEPWARDMLDLPRSPALERAALRPVGGLATRAVRWGLAGVGGREVPSDDAPVARD